MEEYDQDEWKKIIKRYAVLEAAGIEVMWFISYNFYTIKI